MIRLPSSACRLPANLIQAFLEVSGQTSPKETTDAQEQTHRESDRYDAEEGWARSFDARGCLAWLSFLCRAVRESW